MAIPSTLCFREAAGASDLEQVHALNHTVFAEEIGQHPAHSSRLLVDRLHSQSRYFLALRKERVVGMISTNAGPEFSITRRLPDPSLLRNWRKPLEIRLLAIHPSVRNQTILGGLLWQVYVFASSECYSHLLISGIAEREGMYRKLGFQALGAQVSEGRATFVPMMLPLGDPDARRSARVRLYGRRWEPYVRPRASLSLLPGPVPVHATVARSYSRRPVSHRSSAFIEAFEEVRANLRLLLPPFEVALFPGSGTLANDVVAANLKAIFGQQPGLIVSNGEFGDRLIRQAGASGLHFRELHFPWGEAWALPQLEDEMALRPAWVWAVHVETSTGMLNDVNALLSCAGRVGAAVALDCVSSLGAVGVPSHSPALCLASSVSGKSLGSFAGLACVFASQHCLRQLQGKPVCPSFDLVEMQAMRGPVSTVSSAPLFALQAALRRYCASPAAVELRLRHHAVLGHGVRTALRALGIPPIAAESAAAPHITSFALPDAEFPNRCLGAGYEIARQSSYLQARNWGQIATMGEVTLSALTPLFQALSRSRETETV